MLHQHLSAKKKIQTTGAAIKMKIILLRRFGNELYEITQEKSTFESKSMHKGTVMSILKIRLMIRLIELFLW
jgi:hypothetical protein